MPVSGLNASKIAALRNETCIIMQPKWSEQMGLLRTSSLLLTRCSRSTSAFGGDRESKPPVDLAPLHKSGLGAAQTYIPMARGSAYLIAAVDAFSRKVLAQKEAITLEACHCEGSRRAGVCRFGTPEAAGELAALPEGLRQRQRRACRHRRVPGTTPSGFIRASIASPPTKRTSPAYCS